MQNSLLILVLCLVSFLVLHSSATKVSYLQSYDSSSPFPKILYERYRKPWNLVREADQEEVHFWVALKQRNLKLLDKIFHEVSDPTSPSYTDYLSIEEVLNIIAPPKSVQNQVEKWLRSAGGVKKLISYGDAFDVVLTGKAASTLFKTPFYLFEHATTKFQTVRQLNGFTIDASVRPYIELVSGLTDFPYVQQEKKQKPVGTPDATYGFVIPQTIRNVYNIPNGTVVKNPKNTQGVIEFSPVGGPYFSDLQNFATKSDEIFTNISHIVGPYFQGSNDGESVLDVELITNVAPKAFNWYWTFPDGWAYEMALGIFNEPNSPYVLSVSYGWPEVYSCQSSITHANCSGIDVTTYVNRANTEFQKVAVRGISVLIATQDEGAPSEANEDCALDNSATPVFSIYPSASPYVTAVSGTTILPESVLSQLQDPPICGGSYPCTHGTQEDPCTVANTYYRWTTGGGFSNYGARPSYQSAAVHAYLISKALIPPTTLFPSTMRGYADVAAVGARILTISNGGIVPSAGTSASTPIFSGVVTLLNDRRISKGKKQLGFLNPLLYQMAAAHPEAFHDIVNLNNRCTIGICCKYGYGATTGWDPVSGLGTPNFVEMANYIDNLPK